MLLSMQQLLDFLFFLFRNNFMLCQTDEIVLLRLYCCQKSFVDCLEEHEQEDDAHDEPDEVEDDNVLLRDLLKYFPSKLLSLMVWSEYPLWLFILMFWAGLTQTDRQRVRKRVSCWCLLTRADNIVMVTPGHTTGLQCRSLVSIVHQNCYFCLLSEIWSRNWSFTCVKVVS